MCDEPDFQPLLAWYAGVARDLPWRKTRDPYAILVSEIMLQQTRVETVIPYYQRFLQRFPTASSLAGASLEEVYAAWAGLGYYSRARNLQRAATAVYQAGNFPQTEEALRALPGVGEYTAAALASIAFQQPAVALDGNAVRVLARYFGYAGPVGTSAARKHLRQLTQPYIPPARAGDFTQALMELGASLCSPRRPRCPACPLQERCQAHRQGHTDRIPLLKARRARETVAAVALRIRQGDRVLLERRSQDVFLTEQWVTPWLLADDPQRLVQPYREQFPGEEPRLVGKTRHGVTYRDLNIEVWEWQTVREDCAADQRWSKFVPGAGRLPRFTSKILEV